MTTSPTMPDVSRSPWPGDQIAEYYRAKILAGEIKEGDLLPTARQIRDQWHVGIKTAVRAMRILRNEGLIETRPAKPPMVIATPPP